MKSYTSNIRHTLLFSNYVHLGSIILIHTCANYHVIGVPLVCKQGALKDKLTSLKNTFMMNQSFSLRAWSFFTGRGGGAEFFPAKVRHKNLQVPQKKLARDQSGVRIGPRNDKKTTLVNGIPEKLGD